MLLAGPGQARRMITYQMEDRARCALAMASVFQRMLTRPRTKRYTRVGLWWLALRQQADLWRGCVSLSLLLLCAGEAPTGSACDMRLDATRSAERQQRAHVARDPRRFQRPRWPDGCESITVEVTGCNDTTPYTAAMRCEYALLTFTSSRQESGEGVMSFRPAPTERTIRCNRCRAADPSLARDDLTSS